MRFTIAPSDSALGIHAQGVETTRVVNGCALAQAMFAQNPSASNAASRRGSSS